MNKFKTTLDVLRFINKKFKVELDYNDNTGISYVRFDKFYIYCIDTKIEPNINIPPVWYINQMQDIHIVWTPPITLPMMISATMHEQINNKLLIKKLIVSLIRCNTLEEFAWVVDTFGDNKLTRLYDLNNKFTGV